MLANRAELAARAGDDVKGGTTCRQRTRNVEGNFADRRMLGGLRSRASTRCCCAIDISPRPRWRGSSRRSTRCDRRRTRISTRTVAREAVLADVFDRWGQPDSAAAHRALARPGAPLTVTRLAAEVKSSMRARALPWDSSASRRLDVTRALSPRRRSPAHRSWRGSIHHPPIIRRASRRGSVGARSLRTRLQACQSLARDAGRARR